MTTKVTVVLDEVQYFAKHVRIVRNGKEYHLPKYSVLPKNVDKNTTSHMQNGVSIRDVPCFVMGYALNQIEGLFK